MTDLLRLLRRTRTRIKNWRTELHKKKGQLRDQYQATKQRMWTVQLQERLVLRIQRILQPSKRQTKSNNPQMRPHLSLLLLLLRIDPPPLIFPPKGLVPSNLMYLMLLEFNKRQRGNQTFLSHNSIHPSQPQKYRPRLKRSQGLTKRKSRQSQRCRSQCHRQAAPCLYRQVMQRQEGTLNQNRTPLHLCSVPQHRCLPLLRAR